MVPTNAERGKCIWQGHHNGIQNTCIEWRLWESIGHWPLIQTSLTATNGSPEGWDRFCRRSVGMKRKEQWGLESARIGIGAVSKINHQERRGQPVNWFGVDVMFSGETQTLDDNRQITLDWKPSDSIVLPTPLFHQQFVLCSWFQYLQTLMQSGERLEIKTLPGGFANCCIKGLHQLGSGPRGN